MKRILPLLLFLFPVLFSFNSDGPDLKKQYSENITAEDLKKYLSVIASDSFEGRETGKKGQQMTAEYLAAQFRSFGIPGLKNTNSPEDYYQSVPLEEFVAGEGSVRVGEQEFRFGKDFYYTSNSEEGALSISSFVFAGYGIDDSLYSDYASRLTDGCAKGKALMILSDEPTDQKGNSLLTGKKELSSWSTQRRRKVNAAKRTGATALFIVANDLQKNFAENKKYIMAPSLRIRSTAAASASERDMSVLFISREMADVLFKAGKQHCTVASVKKKIAKQHRPVNAEFSVNCNISIKRLSHPVESENVLAFIEGSDLKDQIVVVTAHMDHLGKDSTHVFNGADDDGSGTVSVLEMAKAFARAKKDGRGPRRSMLFMLFTGEEKGLLGSRYYSDHPVFPLANTVCDLNIDMVGRTDDEHKNNKQYVYVIGSEMLSSDLKKIDEQNNTAYTGLKLDYRYDDPKDPNSFYTRSDHYNFAKHEIPVAFFFNGVHADYHKETDEVSKIDFPLMETRARLVFCVAWDVANRDERLVVDKKKSSN